MYLSAPSVKTPALGFRPLTPLLQTISPETLNAAAARVAAFKRDEVIERFQQAFNTEKRLRAFIMADALIDRGIPPCFWHVELKSVECSISQKYDLMLFDLRWLRRWHREHMFHIRYKRYRDLLIFGEPNFHNAAEYAFYAGRRPAWKIVGSMSLTIQQQWDCAWLRSAPITKQAQAARKHQETVFQKLKIDLQKVRRSMSFTDEDALATLLRRHNLWVCSQMTKGSASATAIRYTQLTGLKITRDITARQLQIVADSLKQKRITESCEA
jgi:hypothetical protein